MLEGRAPGSARHALTRPLALRTCLITRIDHAQIGSDPGRHALGQTDIAATPGALGPAAVDDAIGIFDLGCRWHRFRHNPRKGQSGNDHNLHFVSSGRGTLLAELLSASSSRSINTGRPNIV